MPKKFSALRSFGISILSFVILLVFGFFFILPFSERLFTFTVFAGLFLPLIADIFNKKKSKNESNRAEQRAMKYFDEYNEAEKKHREKTGSLKYFLWEMGIFLLLATINALITIAVWLYTRDEKLSWYIFMGGICIPILIYFVYNFYKTLMRIKLVFNGMWAATFPAKEGKE